MYVWDVSATIDESETEAEEESIFVRKVQHHTWLYGRSFRVRRIAFIRCAMSGFCVKKLKHACVCMDECVMCACVCGDLFECCRPPRSHLLVGGDPLKERNAPMQKPQRGGSIGVCDLSRFYGNWLLCLCCRWSFCFCRTVICCWCRFGCCVCRDILLWSSSCWCGSEEGNHCNH